MEEEVVSVKLLLAEKVVNQIDAMEKMEVGSEQHKLAVDELTKMLDKLNEMEKNDCDYWDKNAAREKETELKLKQMDEDKKDRLIKNCLTAVGTIGGLLLTIWGTKVSIDFEKEGTITTFAGRSFFNRLFPKK